MTRLRTYLYAVSLCTLLILSGCASEDDASESDEVATAEGENSPPANVSTDVATEEAAPIASETGDEAVVEEEAAPEESAEDAIAPLDPPQTVQLGTVGAFSDMGLYLAIDRGYFEDVGLEVELSNFSNSGEMIAPLANDDIQVAGGAVAPGLWNSVARGLDIRAVADKGSTPEGFGYSGMLVPVDSPIEDCEDMAGTRLAISAQSNSVLHSTEIWLDGCGLELGEDVETTVLGFGDMGPALENGSVDVAQSIEPLMTLTNRNGISRTLITEDELRPGMPTQQAILLYSPGFREDTEAANRFMLAYVRGVQDYLEVYDDQGEPIDGELPQEFLDVVFEYTRLDDAAVVNEVTPAGLDEFGRLGVESIRSDFEWFQERGDLESNDIGAEDVIDTSFTDFVEQQLSGE